MTTNRITNPLRLAKLLVGAAGAVLSVGLPRRRRRPGQTAGASQPSQPGTPQDFWPPHARQAITGTDPAMLGDGYNVAGNCGISTPRVLRWLRAWCGTIHS